MFFLTFECFGYNIRAGLKTVLLDYSWLEFIDGVIALFI